MLLPFSLFRNAINSSQPNSRHLSYLRDQILKMKMKYHQRKRSNCILTCRQVTSIQQSWTCPHQPAQKSPPHLGTSSIISPKPFSSQPKNVHYARYKPLALSKYLIFLLQQLKGLLQVLSIHCCLHFWGTKEKQHTSPWLCFANKTRRTAPRVVACAEAESIIDQTMSTASITQTSRANQYKYML